MRIEIEVNNVYGELKAHPVCDKARIFCSIAGTKTLTREALTKIKMLGYEILRVREEILVIKYTT